MLRHHVTLQEEQVLHLAFAQLMSFDMVTFFPLPDVRFTGADELLLLLEKLLLHQGNLLAVLFFHPHDCVVHRVFQCCQKPLLLKKQPPKVTSK